MFAIFYIMLCILAALLVKELNVSKCRDGALLTGTCAGLAKRLNVSPVPIRIALILSSLVLFAGLVAYIIFAFILKTEDAAGAGEASEDTVMGVVE